MLERRLFLDFPVMALLCEYASGPPRPHRPLLLIQSSVAQSGVPLLRHVIAESSKDRFSAQCLVFCLLHLPSDLVERNSVSDRITVHDWIGFVPGYNDALYDVKERILQAIQQGMPFIAHIFAPPRPLHQ